LFFAFKGKLEDLNFPFLDHIEAVSFVPFMENYLSFVECEGGGNGSNFFQMFIREA